MEHILALGLLLAFCLLFKGVYSKLSNEKRLAEVRQVVDQQLAAAFIAVATDIYKERNMRPDLAQAMRMQRLIEKQDDLVEQYFLTLESEAKDKQLNPKLLHAVK